MKVKAKKIVALLFTTVLALTVCVGCGKGTGENNAYMDLKQYFNIESVTGYDVCAIVIDNNIVNQGIIDSNKKIYIPYNVVRSNINKKFYVDKNEKLLIYTTPDKNIDSKIGTAEYTQDGVSNKFDTSTSLMVEKEVYISLEYCMLMQNNISYKFIENPNRLVINTILNNTKINVKADSKVRYEADPMSEILIDVKKGDELYLVEEVGEYTKVANETGIVGYIKKTDLEDEKKTASVGELNYEPMVYDHTLMEGKVCLGWHQVGSTNDNGNLNDLVSETKGLNVVSPTWYQLNDAQGGFSSFSSSHYVEIAHMMNIKVWGLISDFAYDEENECYFVNEVLPYTSARRNLISALVAEAVATGLDGINVDFEKISSENGEAYVQFIRELSIECRDRNLVLSVDMYVPIASNMYYDRTSVGEAADYVIVMSYDEHWAGCKEAGSVASIGFVTDGITNTITEVEAQRVINAIPFYTRVWKEIPEELAEADAEIIEDSVFGNYALESYAVGMGTAKKTLADHNANITWLEDLGQYYGEYVDGGITYRIWLEDQESITKKLEVMSEYNLGGVACWKLGLEINDVWNTINEYVNSNS